jgi:hypothetical protein
VFVLGIFCCSHKSVCSFGRLQYEKRAFLSCDAWRRAIWDKYRRLREFTLRVESAGSSETSVNIYED